MSQEYSDSLLGLYRGVSADDPDVVLDRFLAPYEMWPDVRSQVVKRFWQRESLYRVIMRNISAWDRLKENITYAMTHEGNVASNIVGYPRIGKSTVGRFLSRETYRIQFGTRDGWEEKVIFARSYSRATEALKELTRSLLDQGMGDDEVIAALTGYHMIEDENQIEREKDSVKAKTDMKTIAESCASSGVHFWYLSPERRGFGYFTIWVVGIDSKRQRNLSFYLSNDDECHGYLVTPNVPAFDAYTTMKNRIVVQTMADGGRVESLVKKVKGEKKPVEPPELVVAPDADFMEVLAQSARIHLTQVTQKPEIIDRWLHRYFQGLTYKQIADIEGNIRADSVGRSLRELEKTLTNTLKGDILEEALCAYLNQRWQASPTTLPLPATKPNSSTELLWRRGWRGTDVAIPECVAVNCKLYIEHRSSWQVKCLPEAEILPGAAYLLLCELGPPQPSLRVFPGTPVVDVGSVEELSWKQFMDCLTEHFIKAVARGMQVERVLKDLLR